MRTKLSYVRGLRDGCGLETPQERRDYIERMNKRGCKILTGGCISAGAIPIAVAGSLIANAHGNQTLSDLLILFGPAGGGLGMVANWVNYGIHVAQEKNPSYIRFS